jgi:hypothetical protein
MAPTSARRRGSGHAAPRLRPVPPAGNARPTSRTTAAKPAADGRASRSSAAGRAGTGRAASGGGGGAPLPPSTPDQKWIDAPVGVQHRFVHHLGHGRMREHRVHQVFLGRLQRATDDIALDQLGHFRADHVGAQQLAGLGVEDGLDQALGLAQRDRLAVADEGEAADLDLVARAPFAFASVRPTEATCGLAVGAARDGIGLDRMGMPARDQFGDHHALVAGLVGKPRRAAMSPMAKPLAPRCGRIRPSPHGCGRPSPQRLRAPAPRRCRRCPRRR